MTIAAVEQRADLARPPAFVPLRKSRTQVQTKHAHLTSGGHDLEKRMPRAGRVMPLVILNLLSTEKSDRVIASRCPERKLRHVRETFDDHRIRRFLKDDEIRSSGDDRLRQRLFPAASPKANVVAEQP